MGAAAQHYFKTPAADLTVEEATLLVTVMPDPMKFRVDNPSDVVHGRQAFIRARMAELGADYLDAINTPRD